MKTPVACLFLTLPLHAAGDAIGINPIPVEAGPRALALGNAFTAIADDASANAWNPAGMSIFERPEGSISGGWYNSSYSGGGADNAEGDDRFDLDHIGLVIPFSIRGIAQSIGVTWQREWDFSSDFLTRYDITTSDDPDATLSDQRRWDRDQDGALTSLNLSYAFEPHPILALGATVGIWEDDLTGASDHTLRTHLGGHVTITDESPFFSLERRTDYDQNERIRSEVTSGTHIVLGSLWRPTASVTIGLSLRPAFTLDYHDHRHLTASNQTTSELTFSGSTNVSTTTAEAEETEEQDWQLRLPTRLRLGGAYRFDDRRTLSCDLGWTRWQDYQRTAADGSKSSPLTVHRDADEHDDGFSLHVGYEHIQILPRMALVWRCGASVGQHPGLMPAPAADRPQEVDIEMENQYAVGAGIGFFRRRVLTDIGLQFRWIDDTGTGYATAIDEEVDLRQLIVRCGLTVYFP